MLETLKRQKYIIIGVLFLELVSTVGARFLIIYFPEWFTDLNASLFFFIIASAVFIINAIVFLSLATGYERLFRKNVVRLSAILGADIKEVYLFGEIGILSYNDQHEIIFMSDLFETRNISLIGMRLDDWIPNLQLFFDENNPVKQMKVPFNNRVYQIHHLEELRVLMFKDVTEFENLYQAREEQMLVVGIFVLDNYSDLVKQSSVEIGNELEVTSRRSISEWAKNNDIVVRQIKEDTYFAVLQEKTYQHIKQDNFRLLDFVRAIPTQITNLSLTMSMGFGRGHAEPLRLTELATNAVDVALSRGGDQVVISNFGSAMEFYGGKTETKARSNGVKERVLAQSFLSLLQSYKSIYIMGHDQADLDAMGAALGIYGIARFFNKNAWIIMDEKQLENKTKQAIKKTFTKNQLQEMTVSPLKNIDRLDDDALLVFVDTNRVSLLMAPKWVEKTTQIAVIDHHRKAEDAIAEPTFEWIDTRASSTSEMVADLIRYSPSKIMIPSQYSTILLAGILLDTNHYRQRTTTRTYEASMTLTDNGASSSDADDFLKDEYEEYLLKTKIMNDSETPAYGVVVTMAPNDLIIDRSLLAQVAQDALRIKGIKAIFVVGRINEELVHVSGRSDGSINVQMIVEKLGGGGHYSSAAAQLKEVTVGQAKEQLMKVLELYLGEAQVELKKE